MIEERFVEKNKSEMFDNFQMFYHTIVKYRKVQKH